MDSIDYLHIVGEIENGSVNSLKLIEVAANIFDSGGNLVDTDKTYVDLENLPAGEKTCFQILLPQPTNWSFYEFEAPTYTIGVLPPNLSIINDSGSYNPTFGWYEIVGQIRNDHTTVVQFVSSVGTVYNLSGTVRGCKVAYVNSTDLDIGQISSFKLIFTSQTITDTASYRLQADGTPQ